MCVVMHVCCDVCRDVCCDVCCDACCGDMFFDPCVCMYVSMCVFRWVFTCARICMLYIFVSVRLKICKCVYLCIWAYECVFEGVVRVFGFCDATASLDAVVFSSLTIFCAICV